MNNEIDIRPATSVYGTYRRLSYKPWFAIAEFIDNSTQSYYDHRKELKNDPNFKRLVINIRYDSNEQLLEITKKWILHINKLQTFFLLLRNACVFLTNKTIISSYSLALRKTVIVNGLPRE